MKHHCLKWLTCALLATLTAVVGCNRPAPPPTPLTAEELPSALDKAFSKAKPEVKELAAQIVAAVQAKDYSKAHFAIQTLASKPGLTKDQLSVASRGMLTVSELLQAAQTQGDQKAAQTLKTYRLDK